MKQKKKKYAYVRFYLNLIRNNPDFKHKIINTICDYANNVCNIEKVKQLIEEYKKECPDLVANSQLRWSSRYYNSVLEGVTNFKTSYYNSLNSLYNFYNNRPTFIFQHMKEYMKLKGNQVNLTIEIQGKGKVQVNSILPKFRYNTWIGKYFSLIPINIKAIPDKRHKFKQWNGYIHSIQQKEEIVLLNSSKIIAIFE